MKRNPSGGSVRSARQLPSPPLGPLLQRYFCDHLISQRQLSLQTVAAYRDALAQDPLLHDAHFNLSRLHEKANRPREALRHLLAYRRHLDRYGE